MRNDEPAMRTIYFMLVCLIGIQTVSQSTNKESWMLVLIVAAMFALIKIATSIICDIFEIRDIKKRRKNYGKRTPKQDVTK